METNVAIKIKNLTKTYYLYDNPVDRLKEALNPFGKQYHHDFHALNDVSFDILRGETVGIIGKNGAGKSTLLKIITGVLTPTSGQVETNGSIASLLELGAGFNPEMSGMENIYLNGTLMGFTQDQMRERIETILDFADIGEFIHQPVKTYSSGMFARLAFSVAINVDPDILIVDEALSVGDMRFQLKCMQKFDDFRNAGKTILFVTHDIYSVKRFCSLTLWINDGELQSIGDTDYVTDRYLDFLKIETSDRPTPQTTNDKSSLIAQIKNLSLSKDGLPIESIHYKDSVTATIEYEVFDDSIKDPVLGIAIYSIDNQYICGLNTLLDGTPIPWQPGLNSHSIEYTDFNLIGGTFYFDIALFEKNAAIPFDYRKEYCKFIVHTPYVAEGICVLNHRWKPL
jgi:ABC-type polysaccharide/polyol phosphate transport system ATPase subunit